MKQNFLPSADGYDQQPAEPFSAGSIAETQLATPEGAYTTFRTYERFFVLNLSRHFSRLEETSRLAGHPVQIRRPQLKSILSTIVADYGEAESRLRVTVDLSRTVGDLYAAIEKLSVPAPALYQSGIETITEVMHRDNPKAKLSGFLAKAAEAKREAGKDYEEILMVDEKNDILEGLSSNFYGIRDGKLFTAEAGVLSGTTRDYVLGLAGELGIPVILEPVRIDETGMLEEAFITSTSRSILPVTQINGVQIGGGVPGSLTRRLMTAFTADLQRNLEALRDNNGIA